MKVKQQVISIKDIFLFEIESVKSNKYLTESEKNKKIALLLPHTKSSAELKV